MSSARWLIPLLPLCLLVACKPSAEQEQRAAEQRRQHCLDNICEGDVLPTYDRQTHTAFKRDGRWFIGPKEYAERGSIRFYWPSRAVAGGDRDDLIEVFITRGTVGDAYDGVRSAEKDGKVEERRILRPGLTTYQLRREPGAVNAWLMLVATDFTGMGQTHPTLNCRLGAKTGCSTDLQWKPGIQLYVRMLSRKHANDWPEIYAEIVRIVALIKEQ